MTTSDTLVSYIQEEMLAKLFAKVSYPPAKKGRHYFVTEKHIDLDNALTTDPELDQEDKAIIRLIQQEDGESAAKKKLLKYVNARKAKAFQTWIDLLQKDYSDQPAFQLLLMRPLFDASDSSTRRTVVPHSSNVIDWIYRRMAKGRLTPNDNIARLYSWKLAAGTQRIALNGWQYIPCGREHAAQLSAASRGSGWCVAERQWARDYLDYSDFYILRDNGKPVVALRGERIDGCFHVNECQGRYNSSPEVWFPEIELFIRTQDMHLDCRVDEIVAGLEQSPDWPKNLSEEPVSWWLEHVKYWPFVISLAPTEIRPQMRELIAVDVAAYIGFPNYRTLSSQIGFEMGLKEWQEVIALAPYRFPGCPRKYRDNENLQNACIQGWIERIEDDEITLSEIEDLPAFVKANDGFRNALLTTLPDALKEKIRNPPRTADQRLHRFKLDDYLPVSGQDPFELAVEHALNTLLNNQDENFTDDLFSQELRERADFAAVRAGAWSEAIKVHPPLWFALPDDLARLDDYALDHGDNLRVDLHPWVLKVTESPWMLTQKNSVPKSIRKHREILDAYKIGWIYHLRDTPWRIWLKRGLYRRVYLSYALLADDEFVAALAQSWERHTSRARWAWNQPSERMKNMLVMQVAFLRANSRQDGSLRSAEASIVGLDIGQRFSGQMKRHPNNPHIEEIKRSLSLNKICY